MFPGHAVTVKWLTFCPFIDVITIISKFVTIARSFCVYLMKLLRSIRWETPGYSAQCIRRMWNEVIMDYISVPPWNIPGGTEKSHDDPFKIVHLLTEIMNDIPDYKIARVIDVIFNIPTGKNKLGKLFK